MANTFRTPLISNPIGRNKFPGLVEIVSSFVLTTLALNVIAPPHDLPNPPKRPTYVQVEQVSAPTLTTLRLTTQSPFYEISQPSKRPIYNQIDPIPNLLFNTLRAQVGVPFFSVDIANPSRRPIAPEPIQVQAPVLTTLFLNAQVRSVKVIPLAPRRPYYQQVDPPPNLLNTTLLSTAAIQYLLTQEKDRPNPPRRPIAPEPIQVQAPVLTTLAFKAQVPNPLILNSPKKPVYVQVDEFGVPLELRQIIPAIPPFIPPIQENPSRKILSLVAGTFYPGGQIAPSGALAVQPPFFLNDQPNPNRRDPDLKALIHTVVSIFGPNPFSQNDQPNPSRKPIYNQIEPPANILTLGIPIPPPFKQNDQPNPSKRPISYQDQNLPRALALGIPAPAPPGNLNDQPNPSRRPISYSDFNRGISLTLGIPIPPAPFFQTDQPNPSRRPISYQDQNISIPLALGLPTPPPPFYQTDFPNPIQGKLRIQPDIFANQQTLVLQPPVVVLPFSNTDWPTPVRHKDINNQGIFDFGGTVFGMGNTWSIITEGSGTWTPIGTGTNSWGGIVTGNNSWIPLAPKTPTGNSGGVT